MQICNTSVKSNTHKNVNTMCYATHQIINYKRKTRTTATSNVLRSKQKVITKENDNLQLRHNERAFEHVWERVWWLRTLGHQTSCMFAIHTPTRTGNFYILKRTFSSVLTNILNGWLVWKREWLLPEQLCILNAFLSFFVINERMTTACL